jgi:hypothetical protein
MKLFFNFILLVNLLAADEAKNKLWEVIIVTNPAVVIIGEVSIRETALADAMIINSEINGRKKIVQRYIPIEVKVSNKIIYKNSAFDFMSKNLLSEIKFKSEVDIRNIYLRGGSHDELTLITVPVKNYTHQKKALVISREVIGNLDFFILEAILDDEDVAKFTHTTRQKIKKS